VAGTFLLPPHVPYAVVIAVGGSVQIAGLTLEPEHAALVPKAAIAGTPIRAASMQAGVLIAAPGL